MAQPSPNRRRGYNALRRGRIDIVGADYFVTVTLQRQLSHGKGLLAPVLASNLKEQWTVLEKQGRWKVRGTVIMPDHVHLPIRLDAGQLADAIRVWKGALTPALRTEHLSWQPSFYDRRLRPEDNRINVVRYMWSNPYRAKLLKPDEAWPGWWADEEVARWLGKTPQDTPQPEWWIRSSKPDSPSAAVGHKAQPTSE